MAQVILFVFGTIVGSFLNVIALRFDTRNFGGRSKCPHCKKTLRWHELIPIASFFIQKGRCRNCKSKISFQYPLIEAFTGLIFISVSPWMIPVFCIYIVILIYDFYHKIIPDPLVYSAITLSLFGRGWFAGPAIFVFFAVLWLVTKGRAMGFGDAKLGASIGFLLGTVQGLSAIVLAFWIGAAVSLFLISRRRFKMKSEVPFAPFMILGAWLAAIFDLNLLNV